MLELKEIIKHYPAGDKPVKALRGVSLKFRQSEFVSILGPSGCGKTTLLNIIGGLDQYTSGDLTINGKSTKNFKDRDWDAYRNHSIGFVFQNYNLIPHQTVLQNVEIALTVSGVSKTERRKRAIGALKQVGLDDQLNKRPNQISGGQTQRVAIARALVNDPDIILADEPTGALDTETGIQVMEILKKIAKDRLVIMVTHNPNLANKYSTRIIRMLDGEIISDSSPLEKIEENKTKVAGKKPSMSFATAFMLSLKNLFTKKGRTTLTAFAGSIGIMGIALILAVSQGMTSYIDTVQKDALSSYPLSIEETSVDILTLMETFMNVGNVEIEHDKEAVYKKTAIYDMISAFNNIESNENDLKSFKSFLEEEYNKEDEGSLGKAITGLQYSYDLDLNIYTKNVDGDILKSDTRELLRELMAEHLGADISALASMSGTSPFNGMESMNSMGMLSMNLWQEILSGKDGKLVNDVLKKQYDVVYGSWPNSYDEIVLVLDKNNELDDITLYALGLESKKNIDVIMSAALNGTGIEKSEAKWSYEEILESEYRVILNSNSYIYDESSGLYVDLRGTEAGLKYLYNDALVLKVTGIIRPNENAQSTMLSGAIGYTADLTKYIVEASKDSIVIKAQKDNKTTDILNGLPFKSNTGNLTSEEKERELYEYLSSLDKDGKATAYIKIMSIPPQEQVEAMVAETMNSYNRADMEAIMAEGLTEKMGIGKEAVGNYISSMSDEEIVELFAASIVEQFKVQYAKQVESQLGSIDSAQLAAMLDQGLANYTGEDYEIYYDEIMEFSEKSYEENLTQMGYVDMDSPKVINIFASSFENKSVIENAIKDYNEGKPELSQIKYTDFLGIIMSSINSIINAITYVLLAFVAISLIVSSIMIGVITLISVQERTKEIGILRAIGASKSDVSSMFNAETVIIGLASGLLGITVTYLLCIPINIILHKVTGIGNLSAFLPVNAAAILVLISIGLSLIAGFIPSRSAAKKDPVVALRTE
ncbi:MAG: ABC transporter ATP-binding protein/permease [Dehalococcoidales bacterium]|nr:ABC transporter ATP-binding protein/permease [Dehalococcoidales bacterium]